MPMATIRNRLKRALSISKILHQPFLGHGCIRFSHVVSVHAIIGDDSRIREEIHGHSFLQAKVENGFEKGHSLISIPIILILGVQLPRNPPQLISLNVHGDMKNSS